MNKQDVINEIKFQRKMRIGSIILIIGMWCLMSWIMLNPFGDDNVFLFGFGFGGFMTFVMSIGILWSFTKPDWWDDKIESWDKVKWKI